MSKNTAITRPGQGSRLAGMLAKLAGAYPLFRKTCTEGSEAIRLLPLFDAARLEKAMESINA